jgi:hypothetical protein
MYGYLEMVRQNYDSTHKIKHIEHDRELYVDTCEYSRMLPFSSKARLPRGMKESTARLTQSSAMVCGSACYAHSMSASATVLPSLAIVLLITPRRKRYVRNNSGRTDLGQLRLSLLLALWLLHTYLWTITYVTLRDAGSVARRPESTLRSTYSSGRLYWLALRLSCISKGMVAYVTYVTYTYVPRRGAVVANAGICLETL